MVMNIARYTESILIPSQNLIILIEKLYFEKLYFLPLIESLIVDSYDNKEF